MDAALKRDLRKYPLYFLVWTVIGVFFSSQGLVQKFISHDSAPWWHHVVSWFTGVYLWAFLTPLVLWLGVVIPIERPHRARRIALHFGLAILVSLLHLAIESEILNSFGVFPAIMRTFASTFSFLLIIWFHSGVINYAMILVAQHGIYYYQSYRERTQEALRLELRTSELQSQLVQAKLGSLKMQLQPHFLFNTLNAVVVLVRQQKTQQAEQTLTHLSDLLRCVLDDVETQEVPLHRELECLRIYLAIEQVRFQDRLRVDIDANVNALDAAVPQMTLQPIVENAIRHGLGRSASAGRININATRIGDTLVIGVQDDGPGFFPQPSSMDMPTLNKGIGLANTRARLRQIYGQNASLITENGLQGGASVTIIIPYHLVQETREPEAMETHAFYNANRG